MDLNSMLEDLNSVFQTEGFKIDMDKLKIFLYVYLVSAPVTPLSKWLTIINTFEKQSS